MHIADLNYFEAVHSGNHLMGVMGGDSSEDSGSQERLLIDFSGGILSVKQGNKLLLKQAMSSPRQIILSLEGSSCLQARTISTMTNGKTKTTINISTDLDGTFCPITYGRFGALF